ncbi:MAG TPA: hypothetical protein ENJ75_00315 [Candidatus Kaiserbacteria bacterium]|nr:hypothetical protein [Candidatus Kaiserbacteria bacterium]
MDKLIFNKIKKAYFIGIGGIGMSALAQLFKHNGIVVAGSDRESSPVTNLLEQKGIVVTFGQRIDNVQKDADVIVYSDAIEDAEPDFMNSVRALGIPTRSYFQMLGAVSAEKRTFAVAGTHGKTTTTGMLAKILIDAGVAPTVVVGSIVKDFGSNYVAGSSNNFVVEACEYHNHLLEFSPEVLVINNLEWDHTDFFPTLSDLQETFRKAISKVPANGVIVTDIKNPNIAPLLASVEAGRVIDYTKEPEYALLLPGEFNQMNARAASAAARIAIPNITDEAIESSLKTFHGTWRRFEYKGKTMQGADVYDDYAHHPTAIKKTIHALREKTTGKVFVAFHPHLFSRTRDLFEDFANAFGEADKVFIAPIYSAREKDDGTVSNETLASRICENGVDAKALDFDEIKAEFLKAKQGDVVMTMGAGDIYKVADNIVSNKYE